MSGIVPKFNSGDLVNVTEYYSDLIPKSYFHALVLGHEIFSFDNYETIVYNVLSISNNCNHEGTIHRAEEMAINLIVKVSKDEGGKVVERIY